MASITRRRGSRKWTAFFRDHNGRLHCRSAGTTDRKEARKIADEYEASSRAKRTLAQVMRVIGDLHRMTGGADKVSAITVRQHAETWLKAKENEIAESSMKFFRGSAQHFLDYLAAKADRCLFEITEADIIAYRDHLAGEVSPATVNHKMSTIKALFSAAKARHLISDDPTEFVNAVKKDKRQAQKRAFTLDELRVVLQVADDEWRSMILFGLYTGQRLMDVATLTWSSIDLSHDCLRLETGKTGRTMTIPLAAPLRQHCVEGLPASDNPDAPIHPRCSMQTQPANSSAFNRLLATAGLRKVDSPEVKAGSRRQHGQLSFHSLRHTCVSMLHENGLPMATVLEFVGHSSSAMSKKYTHVGIENLRKAASSFQKL